MENESRDLNRVAVQRILPNRNFAGSASNLSSSTGSTGRITINDPWTLDLPQAIVDHFEQTSALTGIEPSQLIAATIVNNFAASEVEKKKPSSARKTADRKRSDVQSSGGDHPHSLQLLLPLVSGFDAETA